MIGSKLEPLLLMGQYNRSTSYPLTQVISRNGRSSESRVKNLLKPYRKKQRHQLREPRQPQLRVLPRLVPLLRRLQTTDQGRFNSSRISVKKVDHRSSLRTLPDTLKTFR